MRRRKPTKRYLSTEQLLSRARAAIDDSRRTLQEFHSRQDCQDRSNQSCQSWEEFCRERLDYAKAMRAPDVPAGD